MLHYAIFARRLSTYGRVATTKCAEVVLSAGCELTGALRRGQPD